MRVIMGYTDYPITEFGDESGEEAPVRQCLILDYDCDKYVDVVVANKKGELVVTNIKRGYVSKTRDMRNLISHDEAMKLLGKEFDA